MLKDNKNNLVEYTKLALLGKLEEGKKIVEHVDWGYYDRFKEINDKYLPVEGEGETLAEQIVTAVNKLVYKWYNDGDVYDNVNSGMYSYGNDLSSYANWLDKYCKPASRVLDSIFDCNGNSDTYEDILKVLANWCLNEKYLESMETPKQGSIYDCDGKFEFEENWYDDDEEY